jgi:cytochrome c oxidase subunit IV
VALIIATMKGSMVASVFMHLSHEKKWIYGALLLTVVFFVVLLFLPLLTVMGGIGTPIGKAPAHAQTTEAH